MASYVAKIGLYNNFVARHYRDRLFYLTDAQYYDSTAYNVWAAPDESLIKVKFCSGDNIITMAQGDYPTSVTLTAISTVAGKTSGGFAHGYPDEGRLSANLYLSDVDGDVNCYLATVEITYPYSGMWCPINYTFDLSQNGDAPKLGGKQLALRLQGGRGLELLDQVQVTINSSKQGATIDNSECYNDEVKQGQLSFYTSKVETSIPVEPGTTIGLYPLPEKGWVIDKIETTPEAFANSLVEKDGNYSFTMPSYAVSFKPIWKKGNYKLSASISPSGSGVVQFRKESGMDADPITSAEAGETIYFTFINNPGYAEPTKVKLTDNIKCTGPNPENGTDLGTSIVYQETTDEDAVSNDNTSTEEGDEGNVSNPTGNFAYEYSFSMPDKDVVVNIATTWDVFMVDLSCDPPEGGKASIDDDDSIVQATKTVKAKQTPNDGYQFLNWQYWETNKEGAVDPNTIVTSDENRIRYFVYEAKIEALQTQLSKDKPGSKEYTQHLDEINELKSYRQNLGYVFTMPAVDVGLKVTYVKTPYGITVSSNFNDAGINLVAVDKKFLTLNEYMELYPEADPVDDYAAYIENQKTSSGSYSEPAVSSDFYQVYTGHIDEEVTLVNVTQSTGMYVFIGWVVSYGYVSEFLTPDSYGVTRFIMPAAEVKIVAQYRQRDIVWANKSMQITRKKNTFTITNTSSAIDTFGKTVEYHFFKDSEDLGVFDALSENKISFTLKKDDYDRDIELKITAKSWVEDEYGNQTWVIESDGPVQLVYAAAPNNMFSYYDGENFQDVQLQLYDGNSWIEF